MSTSAASKIEQIRIAAEADLDTFIRLVAPDQLLGDMHAELFSFWVKPSAKTHQLALLPRDHGKSRMVAFRAAWAITKKPTTTILYISATSTLAIKQLQFIKDILTSPIYRYYWPEMVHEDEGKRKKWSSVEVVVDHPARKGTLMKDPTVMAAGLTTNLIGHHFDVCILDDVVVSGNAWTDEGRRKVETQISYLASILGAEGCIWAVGTRYHLDDYYGHMEDILVDEYDADGQLVDKTPLYEIHRRNVEESGLGLGPFLWNRMQAPNGNFYGFDRNVLAKKRAQYTNTLDYRAQYYNDVTDTQGGVCNREDLNYYDHDNVRLTRGSVYHGRNKLNVVMAIDFAYTLGNKSDFTAIAVVGVDCDHNYYILDLDRFKTDKISTYYEHIREMHLKWDVRKLRAEVTAAQSIIVKDLKENWFKLHGLSIAIDDFRPSMKEGSKAERILNTLQPRYAEHRMYHHRGGLNDVLVSELLDGNSPHDDLKDVLASAVDYAKPPSKHNPFSTLSESSMREQTDNRSMGLQSNKSRFGGYTKRWG